MLSCNTHLRVHRSKGSQKSTIPVKKVLFSFFGACHKGGIHKLSHLLWPKSKKPTHIFVSFDCFSSQKLVVDPYWKWHMEKTRVAQAAWCCADREKNFRRLLGRQIVQKIFQQTSKIPFCGSSSITPLINAQRREENDVQSKPNCESELSHKHEQFQFLTISDSYLLSQLELLATDDKLSEECWLSCYSSMF